MNVDVAAYLAGLHVAEHPAGPCSVSEVEDLIRWTIDRLASTVGERFTFERVDECPVDEDWSEATAYFVAAIDAWDEINVDDLEPAEYTIRRWVVVAESTRTLPQPAAQEERLL